MLIQFSFKNYKSFRDDTVLDLSAAKMTEFNAQLIFTTHDTWQLSNQLLRRDEIWFTEKDKQGVSTLYSLADFIDEDGTRIRRLLDILKEQNKVSRADSLGIIWVLNTCVFLVADYKFSLVEYPGEAEA